VARRLEPQDRFVDGVCPRSFALAGTILDARRADGFELESAEDLDVRQDVMDTGGGRYSHARDRDDSARLVKVHDPEFRVLRMAELALRIDDAYVPGVLSRLLTGSHGRGSPASAASLGPGKKHTLDTFACATQVLTPIWA
jgi:hypothetical protein